MYAIHINNERLVPLQNILHAIGHLEKVSALYLPNVDDLGCGFQKEIVWGKAYRGVNGRKYGRTRTRQTMRDIERVAEIVVGLLLHLKTLKIGATAISLKDRSEDGKLIFPWTGRMAEYLLDSHPRYKATNIDGDDEDEDPNGPVFSTWEQDESMLSEAWGKNQDGGSK